LRSAKRRQHDFVTKKLDEEPNGRVDFEVMADAGFDDACELGREDDG